MPAIKGYQGPARAPRPEASPYLDAQHLRRAYDASVKIDGRIFSPMRISTRGRYALRIMLDISMNGSDGRPVSLRDVASRQEISVKYMEQICSSLTRAGLLRSVRGAQGGYLMVGSPSDYTVGRILRVTEGSLNAVPCDEGEGCPRANSCLTVSLWRRLDEAINGVLDNTTLQDLIDEGGRVGVIVPELPGEGCETPTSSDKH